MVAIKQSIENEIVKDVSSGLIILLEGIHDKNFMIITKAIKSLISKGYMAVVLSTSIPASELMKLLKQHNVNISKIYFIDSLSRVKEKGDKTILVSSLSDLGAIVTAFDSVCSGIEKENDFFYIGTVQDLLKEKDAESVIKSFHSIFSKMRLYGIGGMVLSAGGIDSQARAEIAQLCDEVKKQ